MFNFYVVNNHFENLKLNFQVTTDMIEFELDRKKNCEQFGNLFD